jgi:hypothetical protein
MKFAPSIAQYLGGIQRTVYGTAKRCKALGATAAAPSDFIYHRTSSSLSATVAAARIVAR